MSRKNIRIGVLFFLALFKLFKMWQHFGQTEVTMNYITQFIQFLMDYDFIILPCASLAMILFCVTNFCKNVYRKQNGKLASATRKICSFPHKTAQYVNALPPDYQRQWRAYANSGASQPSLVFEFVPKRNRVRCGGLIALAAIVCACYIAAFVFDTTRFDYIVYQVAFWLAFTLVMIANKLLFTVRERKAKKVFARFVNELTRSAVKPQAKTSEVGETVKQINELQKCKPTNAVFDRASQLLREKGLNADRTPDEQRKLNNALNSLLQSYTRNPAQ